MTVSVSVITPKGPAAISSVAVFGDGAGQLVGQVFGGGWEKLPAVGRVVYGVIVDGDEVIDSVVIGCEGAGEYVIHCHGNPILVERVVRLLADKGALVVPVSNAVERCLVGGGGTMIEQEAAMVCLSAVTLRGVELIQRQVSGGLTEWATAWLEKGVSVDLDGLADQAQRILQQNTVARRLIAGARIVLAGPPNSGKSTLLNRLAGQHKAIVADVAGTTRDWVTAGCRVDGVVLEFVDTAGLDEVLAGADVIEGQSQRRSWQLVESCDLIVWLSDATEPVPVPTSVANKAVPVWNKCDLLEAESADVICISAENGQGVEALLEVVLDRLGVRQLSVDQAVAFTPRQCELLERLAGRAGGVELLGQLLKG